MMLQRRNVAALPLGFLALALVLAVTSSAHAVFNQTWQAGIANGNQSEFAQENGNSNLPPGSPTLKDDDWYFAGHYPAPIGILTANSPDNTFERALTNGDPTDRIHFNLKPDQLDDDFFLDVNIVGSNFTGGNIPIHVLVNGVEVFNEVMTTDGLRTTPVFNGKDVGAVSGDNVVTLTRDATGGWTQFDYIRLSNETAGIPFVQLWQVGIDNGNQGEFSSEGAADDDWYFAGTYPPPVGVVAVDDPFNTFERALTNGDPFTNIHFNLSPEQIKDNFFLEVDIISSNFTGGTGSGVIPFYIDFNGVEVFAEVLSTDGLRTTYVFNGMDVGAIAGENIVRLRRDAGGSWTQFDYIRLSTQDVPVPEPTTVGLVALAGLALLKRKRRMNA